MFSGRTNKRRGFTLLEVMLAVAILGLVAVSIYRFVLGTLSAIRVSTEVSRERELVESFANYLRVQMQLLPPDVPGVITGEAHRFNDTPSDELHWITGPGPGLLTRNAEGDWTVILTTQAVKGGTGYELGLRRQDINARNPSSWLPLMGGVSGFEVRYFDSRIQQWLEKWTDTAARPALVRVKLWRPPATDPYEVVLPLSPAISKGQQPANPANPAVPAPTQ